MNRSRNRPLEIFVRIIVLILSAICANPGRAKEYLAEDGSELVRSVAAAEKPEVARISRFRHELKSCRWIVRDLQPEPFDLSLDVYQVTGKTAVPVIKNLTVGSNLPGGEGNSTEVSYRFESGESEKPARFLIRLWLERGEKRNLIDAILLNLEAPGILEPLSGTTFYLAGSQVEPVWADVLRNSDASFLPLDQMPSNREIAVKGVVIVNSPETDRKSSDSLESVEWRREIRLNEGTKEGKPDLTFRESGGWVLTLPSNYLDNMAHDPELQRQFLEWMKTGLNSNQPSEDGATGTRK
ncbi:MAG: hypothetical protein KDN19_07400 [Verrucomicrobiae bacterium]|nr:hypothetical protein [Verrucomicrobiae bacterium]